MAISPIEEARGIASVTSVRRAESGTALGGANETAASFKDAVKNALGEVNHLQSQADEMAMKLATGDLEDVHRAMIAMQKAKLALDLTIQVRNKVIEAYQEIMRMQV